LNPGAIIPFHKHHNAEEVVILEEGGATVVVGDKRAIAGPRSIVFIPRDTWVSLANASKVPIHAYFLFSRPGFENFIRGRSVHPGEPLKPLTPEEIDGYIASNQWEGKAGGYGIQDHDPFVTKMSGSHTNIVGLPMELVEKMLGEANILPVGR